MNLPSLSKCLICAQNITNIILPCHCLICEECIYEWTIQKCKEFAHIKSEEINCPNSCCVLKYSIKMIISDFSSDKQEAINDELLNNYLIESRDTIKCPSNKCNYAGFFDYSQIICSEGYQCELCNYKWNDIRVKNYYFTLLTNGLNPMQLAMTFFYCILNFIIKCFTETVLILCIKKCPNCNRKLFKFTGCDHVSCICKHEFCYICFYPWEQHTHYSIYCSIKKYLYKGLFYIIHSLFIMKLLSLIYFYDIFFYMFSDHIFIFIYAYIIVIIIFRFERTTVFLFLILYVAYNILDMYYTKSHEEFLFDIFLIVKLFSGVIIINAYFYIYDKAFIFLENNYYI